MDSYGYSKLFLLGEIAISASIHIGWETASNSSMNAIVTSPKQIIENRESYSSRNNQNIGVGEIEYFNNLYFYLSQNYNNPINPTINIQYSLPVSGDVGLKVYNSLFMLEVSWGIKVNSYSVLTKREVRV